VETVAKNRLFVYVVFVVILLAMNFKSINQFISIAGSRPMTTKEFCHCRRI